MVDPPDVLKSMLRGWLPQAPVTLVVDPRSPGCANLPTVPEGQPPLQVLLVELAGEPGLSIVDRSDDDALHVDHGLPDGSANLAARIPWAAVFLFVGGDLGKVKIHPDAIPALVDDDRHTSLRWVMRALGLPDLPASGLEWTFTINAKLMAADADRSAFEPEPLGAFQRCMETEPRAAQLLVDAHADGVYVPPAWPRVLDGHALHLPVGRKPPFSEVSADGEEIAWKCNFRDGDRFFEGFFRVPWTAVGAMKHDTLGGWFWPDHLPEPLRAPMMKAPEVAANLHLLRGAPLAKRQELPAEPPRIAYLPAPIGIDKPDALADILARGRGGMVLIDARAPGVVVGDGFKKTPLLCLFCGMPQLRADVRAEEDGVHAELPDFEGRPGQVFAPWSAVLLVGANQGGARMYAWPEDYPDDIRKAVHLMHDLAKRGADPTEAIGKVEGVVPVDVKSSGFVLGMGKDPAGHYVLGIRQPLGKNPQTGDDMNVELQFMLPVGMLH